MKILQQLSQIKRKFYAKHAERAAKKRLENYKKNGRIPWSEGYYDAKDLFLKETLQSEELLNIFSSDIPLPSDYGIGLDERVVEYPWVFSRLKSESGRLLDAGSTLNYEARLDHPKIKNKSVTIVTLEPEECAFWQKRVSYLYEDIRKLPFKDNWFDEVICISTLEHIGMNNALYSSNPDFQKKDSQALFKSASELYRVLKPGGQFFVTIPYGCYHDYGWYQQFDEQLLAKLLSIWPQQVQVTFYSYSLTGWQINNQEACKNLIGIDPLKYSQYPANEKTDLIAASRAIAAISFKKEAI
jgi:SAM-dependent methyltransferase